MANANFRAFDVMTPIGKACERAMTRTAMAIDKDYKQNLRSTLNTTGGAQGHLLGGATYEMHLMGIASWCRVGNAVVYARIHEYGGVIVPKNYPFLVFMTADGEWHSVEMVTIPARPTLRPAMLDHLGEPQRFFVEELSRLRT